MEKSIGADNIYIVISPDIVKNERTGYLCEKFTPAAEETALCCEKPFLRLERGGLSLCFGGQTIRGDFTHLIPRIKSGLSSELIVRASKIKKHEGQLFAIDATAGLGEDSFFLATSGFFVTLYEKNPVIFELLQDALIRASKSGLCEIVGRMSAVCADSIEEMNGTSLSPDVILLDPMFPQRQKSALVKKKLQMIQKLESPCENEKELLLSAVSAAPKKLIIKRPPKGPYLAGIKPDHSIEGKAVRFDCFVSPWDRIDKFKKIP